MAKRNEEHIPDGDMVRTTVFLPRNLVANVDAWCLVHGSNRSEALRTALFRFAEGEGLQPTRKPRIEITYG